MGTFTERSQLLTTNWEELRRFCNAESIKHLERSLVSLEAGAAPTPSFKLYGRTDVSLVTDFLSSLRKQNVYPKWMLDYEDTRVKKFGPQGGHAPWSELYDDFMLYATRPTTAVVHTDILHQMSHDYGALRCQMLSVSDALNALENSDKIQDRAAGWNTFNLKKTDPVAKREAVRLARNGDWKRGFGYVFSRYNKLKKRIFMPMPYSLMLKQAQYFVPFLYGIQSSLKVQGIKSPYLFWADKIGFGPMLDLWNQILSGTQLEEGMVYVFIQRDFEKMDTTTASSQYEGIFIPTLCAAYHQSFQDLHDCMIATTQMPIITPSGTLIGDHGTASGAEVTNGGETVCNDYFDRRGQQIFEGIRERRYRADRVISAGNGDDGFSLYKVDEEYVEVFKFDIAKAYQQAAEECGFRVQADKWFIDTEYGLYCQNMHWIDNGNVMHMAYPAALIINAIVNPEHEYTPSQWDKDYRDIDIIQKLDNGVGLPYYHELVDYIMHGTKYPLLGKDEAETTRILSKYDKYRALQPIGENFNRLDWSISKSPTIKYILEHR